MKLWWLGGLLGALMLAHCATGEDDPVRKKPGGYDDAGAGGTSGSGGVGGSGGAGGSSGADASDAPSDSTSDAIADASSDLSDAPPDIVDSGSTGRLLMIARSATQVTFGETTSSSWTTQSVTRATLSAPAIVTTGTNAVAVVRDQTGNTLAFSSWDPATGDWSSFAAVAALGATISTPALAVSGNVHLAFLGTDNKLYSNIYTPGSGWQATFTNVAYGTVHSFGPSAPALTKNGSGVLLAQEGNDGDLYSQAWQNGWQAGAAHQLTVKIKAGTPPAATTRETSGKLVIAWVETSSSRLMWTEGAPGAWSSPVAVHSLAYSPSTPALTSLKNGSVVIAFRALDDKVYTATMSGSSFGAPVLVHPSLTTTTSPALAPGVSNHVAELAWVSGGSVQHSSLGASGWSGPVAVAAGGHQAVALASYLP